MHGALGGPFLVTGGRGFVGRHLLEHLHEEGIDVDAPARADLDLLNAEAVRDWVSHFNPAVIVHLAALASVRRSWDAPEEPLLKNLQMTLNVLEAVRLESPDTTTVLISSGEIYGSPAHMPVDEKAALEPQNPYAVSKAACDLLGGQYAKSRKLSIVRMRPFNHCGPGQSDAYLVGSLTRQAAQALNGGENELTLNVGALEVARDFTDVRDVARAYLAASALSDGVYNVCSGRALRVRDLIDRLQEAVEIEIRVAVDPNRLRPGDALIVEGSSKRLRAATGWSPAIPMEQTLKDAVTDWRRRLIYED